MTDQEYAMMYLALTPGRPSTPQMQELFIERWQNKIIGTIKKFSSVSDDLDDLYQHIIESWIAEDRISLYDPTIANFSTYVYSYVVGHVKNWRNRKRREYNKQMSLQHMDIEVAGPEPRFSLDYIRNTMNYDMYWLFTTLLTQVIYYGDKDVKQLASIKGMSVRNVNYQIGKLRDTLKTNGYVKRDSAGCTVWADTLY